MGVLRGFFTGAVLVIVVLAILYVFDIVLSAIDAGKALMASALGVNNSSRYSSSAEKAVGTVAWVVPFIVIGAILVYAIHIRRR